jgi:2-C-methyl-D-erythritol 4-phosphate cytidylyltransferase
MSEDISVIICAAGKGTRMPGSLPKQFRMLGDRPLLIWSMGALVSSGLVSEIIVGASKEEIERTNNIIRDWIKDFSIKVVEGGNERQDTVRKCLLHKEKKTILTAIHDGARPFVTTDIINDAIQKAKKYGAATAAIQPSDTIKRIEDENVAGENLDREKLFRIQTPQVFRTELIVRAHEEAAKDGYLGTDDTALVERMGHVVKMSAGSSLNMKITDAEDWEIAEALIKARIVTPGPTGDK